MNQLEAKAIVNLLPDAEKEHVEKFAAYCVSLATEKKQGTQELKNPWMGYKTTQQLADYFNRVAKEGLVFDGKHVTLQSTGISYDYVAYKNKMLLAYPESLVDVSLVYEGDDFMVNKDSGEVKYEHLIKNPFGQKGENIVGGYCVIKNKRGQFLTLLSKPDIEKHRKIAKTDYIWSQWFKEMALKTVIKKACKVHFDDIYSGIEEMDNENNDLDNPLTLDLEWKGEIDAIDSIEALRAYYVKNRGRGKDFDSYVTARSKTLAPNAPAK